MRKRGAGHSRRHKRTYHSTGSYGNHSPTGREPCANRTDRGHPPFSGPRSRDSKERSRSFELAEAGRSLLFQALSGRSHAERDEHRLEGAVRGSAKPSMRTFEFNSSCLVLQSLRAASECTPAGMSGELCSSVSWNLEVLSTLVKDYAPAVFKDIRECFGVMADSLPAPFLTNVRVPHCGTATVDGLAVLTVCSRVKSA